MTPVDVTAVLRWCGMGAGVARAAYDAQSQDDLPYWLGKAARARDGASRVEALRFAAWYAVERSIPLVIRVRILRISREMFSLAILREIVRGHP